jgi:hypothetical protein
VIALVVAVVAVLPSSPVQALVRLPSPADLVAASRSGDELELERVAARLGAARLARIATVGKKDERVAALAALVLVDDGWARLPEVARLIADGDGEVAAAAAGCARRIAEGMTPEVKDRDEMPGDVPAQAARELLGLAQRTSLAVPLRVQSLEALAALRGVTRVDEKAVGKLLGDMQIEVRRAAAEALAGAGGADGVLEAALARDGSTRVASAAAASLCRDVPLVAPTGKVAAGAPDHRAAKLGGAARSRLRALAVDENVPLEDRLDLISCLRVNKKNEDQQTLDTLARRPPESLRRRARALGGR